jgi:hypothetical protein
MRPQDSGSLASPGDPRAPRRCVAVWWPRAVSRGRVVPKRHPPLPCVLHIRRRFSQAPDPNESSCLPQGSSKIAPPSTHPGESTHDLGPGPLVKARGCQASCTFRPRGLVATSTVSSSDWADGLVASHRRPWGSPGCGLRARHACLAAVAFPPVLRPPERSPPAVAVLASPRGRAPLSSHLPRQVPTSRPCSTGESVAASRRCRRGAARCSPGLPRPETTQVSPLLRGAGTWARCAYPGSPKGPGSAAPCRSHARQWCRPDLALATRGSLARGRQRGCLLALLPSGEPGGVRHAWWAWTCAWTKPPHRAVQRPARLPRGSLGPKSSRAWGDGSTWPRR